MDILKKVFGLSKPPLEKDVPLQDDNNKLKTPIFGNDFKKPLWYDEESDDELFDSNKIFGFQIFSNPMEIQRYHEQQMERLFKSLKQVEGADGILDENWREEYMKPGFEEFNNFENLKPSVDTDLDGEIYADQLHSLMQRISSGTDLDAFKNENNPNQNSNGKYKITDDEKIMNQIHGIEDEKKFGDGIKFFESNCDDRQMRLHVPHKGGAFEGFIDGPKTLRQAFSYQIIRRPNGSILTKTLTDANGNMRTTIKTTIDGETKTQTLLNGIDINDNIVNQEKPKLKSWIIDYDRFIYINQNGYALPKNLW